MDQFKMSDDQLDQVSAGTIIAYDVQPGDTLNAIAQKYNVTVDQLQRWNKIQNPNIIAVGQKILLKF